MSDHIESDERNSDPWEQRGTLFAHKLEDDDKNIKSRKLVSKLISFLELLVSKYHKIIYTSMKCFRNVQATGKISSVQFLML